MAERAQMNLDYAKAKIVIGSFELSSDKYGIHSIEIRTGAYDGNAVGIGCAYTSTCSISMQNIDEIKKGIRFEVYFLIKGSWECLGRFWVNKSPTRNKANMTIEAHGALGEFGNNPFYVPGMFCVENKNTIGRLMGFVASTTGIGTVNFYANKPVEPFLEREVTVPVKGDKATFIDTELGVLPNYPAKENDVFVFPGEKEYANKHGISVKDLLSGIAILYGGNVTERNGRVWISPIVRQSSRIFSTQMCPSEFSLPNETYELDCVKLNFIHTKSLDFFARIKNEFFHFPVYCGTDKQEFVWLGWEGNQTGDTAYVQNVECDWVGYSADQMYDNETYAFVDGDFSYRTGNFSFAGYNKDLYAGNAILIEDEDKNLIPFYIGEVSLKWDGGFTTDISCNCNVDESGSFDSSSQSGISSSTNVTSAMATQNTTSFATITLSNVKDSTISGSIFMDGTITGSKIDNSTITNSHIVDGTLDGDTKIANATIGFEKVNKSFINDLTTNEAYIKNLTVEIGKIGYLKTDELISKIAEINSLTATDAFIKNIFSESIIADKTITNTLKTHILDSDIIKAVTAEFGYITTNEADLKYADITFGNIDMANINKANIGILFNEIGLIDRATIVDGHITGFLDAVKVNTNQITAGTLIADRILLRGSENGLLYALNNLGELTSQNINTLDGNILTERTVTADKLVAKSITTNELDAEQIFSNSATIKNIFSQDIEATGTITGATLLGTYAEIESGIIGTFDITPEGLEYNRGGQTVRIGPVGLQIMYSYGVGNYITIDKDGFSAENGIYSIRTGYSPWTLEGTKKEYSLIFADSKENVKSTWINNKGIYTGRGLVDGEIMKYPFMIDTSSLDVTGKINANIIECKNSHGLINVASGEGGGRIRMKGSGNWYEIDADGGTLRFIDGTAGKTMALMNSTALYSIGEMVISNSKSIRFGTPASDYIIKGTETTITIGDKDAGGNSGYIYLQGDTKVLTGSLEAPKIKEGGAYLTDKYCYYQEGTGSVPGGSGWMGVTATFPKPYLKKPFVTVVQDVETSTENIWVQAVSEKAVSFKVYAPNSAWTYSYRWMAIGIKA